MVPPSAHMPMTVTERSISMADPIFMAQDTAKSTRKYKDLTEAPPEEPALPDAFARQKTAA